MTSILKTIAFPTLLLLACVPATHAAGQGSFGDPPAFDAYKIVLERNIFDPARKPGSTAPQLEETPTTSTMETIPTERLVLLGTLLNHQEALAFLEGSNLPAHGAVRRGEQIAGQLLLEIHTGHVTLENNGKRIELPVSWQMERSGEGEWQLSAATAPTDSPAKTADGAGTASQTTASTASNSSPAASPPAATDAMTELEKRLMKRRLKETGK